MVNVGNEEFWTLQTLETAAVVNSDPASEEYMNIFRTGFLIAATSGVVGAVIGAVLPDRFGRKKTLLATSIFVIAQIIGVFFTNTFWSCVPLFFGKIGLGITRVVVPLYICEIVDDNIRGALLMLQLPFFYGGRLIAIGIGSLVSSEILSVVLVLLTVIFLATFTWFPETPYYLVSKKKYKAAAKSLVFYRGIKNFAVEEEIEMIIKNVEVKNDSEGCCKRIQELVRPSNRKGLLIIIFLIIAKWSEEIFDSRNDLSDVVVQTLLPNHNIARIVVYAISLITSLIIVFTIDVIGRRSFLLYSTFGSFIVIIIILIMRGNDLDEWVCHAIHTALHFCQLIIYFIPFVYVGELFSMNVKAMAIAIVTTFNLFKNFIIIALSESFELDVNSFIIGIVLLFAFPITLAFIPETNLKSFSDIQNELTTTLHCRWLKNKLIWTDRPK